jgi:hypothetical protein
MYIPNIHKYSFTIFLENQQAIKFNIINILKTFYTLFQGWHCVCIHKVEVIEKPQ